MKNTFYSFFIRIIITMLSISSLGTINATVTTKPQIQASIAQLSTTVLKNFYTIISNTKNLNYYKTKEIIFPIPGTKKEYVLNWGFRGSGRLFMPFTPITAKIRESYAQNLKYEESTVIKKTVYALIQDELNQVAKDSSFIKSLTTPELNPVILFGIKVILLFKTTIENQQLKSDTYAQATTELMRLLFRLKLSCEYHGSDIASLFPEKFRQATEINLPGVMKFLNELWIQISPTSSINTQKSSSESIDCFIFNDKEFAEEMAQKLTIYKKNHFISDATELINNNEHQVVTFNEFLENQKTDSTFGQKLVGCLHSENLDNQNIPLGIKQEIEAIKEMPTTKLITTEAKTQWLIHVTTQKNSAKALLLNIAQTLHNYVALKKELLNGTSLVATEYRNQYEERERTAEIIQDFIEESDGKNSLAKLSQEIYEITQPAKAKIELSQNIKKQIDEILAKIQNLKNQSKVLTTEIKDYTTLINAQETNNEQRAILQKSINNKSTQSSIISQQIDQESANLSKLEAEVNQINQIPEVQYEQNVKSLEELKKLLAEQQAQGKNPDEQLLSTINNLQEKLGNQKFPINFEQRIERRQKIADAFNAEANNIENKRAQEEMTIKDTVAKLLWNQVNKKYTTYINHLRKEAKRIVDNNNMAKQLKYYRTAYASAIIEQTPEMLQELQTLEAQVGYLLTGQQEENFMETLTCSQSDIKELLTDLNTQDAFKQIKNQFIESLINIKQNSTFVQKHSALFTELMSMLTTQFPLLTPITNRIS